MLRLDNDVKSLQNFAARAYSNEMNIQKTILKDMLGGESIQPSPFALGDTEFGSFVFGT